MGISAADAAAKLHHIARIRVQFQTAAHAAMAAASLSVDPGLQPQHAWHHVSHEGSELVAEYRADEVRILRVQVSSFYDMLAVLARTLREFADDSGA